MKGEQDNEAPTSPGKGEVDRRSEAETGGRGSALRFSRTPVMTARARRLRGNLTDAELKLWKALRRDQLHGLHFRRQHPVGPYTVDFYCPAVGLAIEIDGGQHAEETKAADDRRTSWLMTKNIVVVRYWNNDVLGNLAGVLSDIAEKARSLRQIATPSPTLPLSGGGSLASCTAPTSPGKGEVDRRSEAETGGRGSLS